MSRRRNYPKHPCPGRCGNRVWDPTTYCGTCQTAGIDPHRDPRDPGGTGYIRVHRGALPGDTFEDLFYTPLDPPPTPRELRQMSLLP